MNAKFMIQALLACTVSFGNIMLEDPLFYDDALCDYLVICANDFGMLQQARRLVDFKQQKGLKTAVVNVDSIIANVDGTDPQHRIRNFIREAHTSWHITWLLLLGDYNLVPARKVSTGGMYFPFDSQSVFSDIYYACLEGEWDIDGDGVYGNEKSMSAFLLNKYFSVTGDSTANEIICQEPFLDLWYDIYIGRLPASDAREAEIMVDKTIQYRLTPRPDRWANDVIFLAAQIHRLWQMGDGPEDVVDDATFYWHYQVKTLFDNTSAFTGMGVDELFEDRILENGEVVNDSNEITYDLMDSCLSRGYNMVFYMFHGNPRGIQLCSFSGDNPKPDYDYRRVLALHSPFTSNIMSIFCSVMKMDPDSQYCFAKSFLVNPEGGGVTHVGATGTDYLHIRGRHFAKAVEYLCSNGVHRISRAFQLANLATYYRHNLFVHQYWGDPELELWTKPDRLVEPMEIRVEQSNNAYLVTIEPALDSVLVCAYKAGEVFSRGYTSHGTVALSGIDCTVEDVRVTATCPDFVPSSVLVNAGAVASRTPGHSRRDGLSATISIMGNGVSFAFANTRGPVEARVTTVSGRTVGSFSTGRPNATWHISSLSSGVYMLRARTGPVDITEKFMIRR